MSNAGLQPHYDDSRFVGVLGVVDIITDAAARIREIPEDNSSGYAASSEDEEYNRFQYVVAELNQDWAKNAAKAVWRCVMETKTQCPTHKLDRLAEHRFTNHLGTASHAGTAARTFIELACLEIAVPFARSCLSRVPWDDRLAIVQRMQRVSGNSLAAEIRQELTWLRLNCGDSETPNREGEPMPVVGVKAGDKSQQNADDDPTTPGTNAVYISYAWGNEGEGIVDRVYDSLKADGYDIRRDKQHLHYAGSISEFMKEIGRGVCIIVVVSDKSLRSPYCMFELLEIHRNQQFRERICPIVISDAKIHSLTDRLEYVTYWKAEYRRLEKLVKKVGIEVLSSEGSFREYEKFRDISQNTDKLLTMLGDMNSSTPARIEANEFELLKQAISKRMERPFIKA